MIDLTTSYMGLKLHTPVVCSSSPLCQDLDSLVQMEQAGAGAVVLHSLFEEQVEIESLDLSNFLDHWAESYSESLSYFPDMGDYNLGVDGYLEHLREAKGLLKVPVIASLNGHTRGGWVNISRQIEEAGADGLELNVYEVPTDPNRSGTAVEDDLVNLVRDVASKVCIPVAVKLGPYYSALAHLAGRLEEAGAKALVLFNRFYQPDLDLERLEPVPSLWLSTADELRLRLHWAAILYGRTKCDVALTGGASGGRDVLKGVMAGASVVMMTSSLLRHGVEHMAAVLREMREWMEEHEYPSLRMMRGSMSLRSVANPSAYIRANYMKVLRSHALRPGRGG